MAQTCIRALWDLMQLATFSPRRRRAGFGRSATSPRAISRRQRKARIFHGTTRGMVRPGYLLIRAQALQEV